MKKLFWKKLLWMVPLALVISILFAVMEWPLWIAFALFVIIAGMEIPIMLYAMYFSQNLQQITKYVDQQQEMPVFAYMHQLREGTKENQLEAIDAVLAKYKQPQVQAVYGANKAIMLDEFGKARRLAEPISSSEIGQYTLALIEAVQGNREQAKRYSLQKEWMKASIEANLAYIEKDREAFEREAQKAINNAKGIQYYSNTYVFKRMRDEWQ
ncbi:hypothetical protein [Lysinibacillus sp. 3P01SB]|uniref:hypothetical protein n=1 Tax=Lysinibacillus sp. 3P01SB TaxID=3132284 RepID=UPI0039A4C7D2